MKFDEALALCRGREGGGRIGLLLTFQGSVVPLIGEIHAMANAIGQTRPQIVPSVAEGALEALQAGDGDLHDRLSAAAVKALPSVDVVVIGQFSMARAAPPITACRREPVLTTPHMAARKLKRLVQAATISS